MENISLINEVHNGYSKSIAEQDAINLLKALSLEEIAFKRKEECSYQERFFVMFLRALAYDSQYIVINFVFSIIDDIIDIDDIISKISLVKKDKQIIFVDIIKNKVHYNNMKLFEK